MTFLRQEVANLERRGDLSLVPGPNLHCWQQGYYCIHHMYICKICLLILIMCLMVAQEGMI